MSMFSLRYSAPPMLAAALACGAAVLPAVASAQAASSAAAHARTPTADDPALRAFFGNARVAGGDAADTLLARMVGAMATPADGDPASRARAVGDGLVLQTGCRERACDEAGAVVYDADAGVVLVAGLIHRNCGAATTSCDGTPTLTVFHSSRRQAPMPALVALDDWAEAQVPDIARTMQPLP
ncbi:MULTISPECIES: hypothetical protein [Luteimonas]|uniref:hypothetical protein n=1 Tax=Luteimonas TaxID=83614 RepID=UPI0011807D7D|nr:MULTISPECIES: hypothetical protein [Luteimonas]